MTLEFPISVKLRDQENYTMFLSNGDSINLVMSDNFISKLYRNHTGMHEYENLVNALCEIHKVITTQDFDNIYEEYCKQESEFLEKDRPKKMLNAREELEQIVPKRKDKKKEKTLKLDFGE